jgi:hypothetical protein
LSFAASIPAAKGARPSDVAKTWYRATHVRRVAAPAQPGRVLLVGAGHGDPELLTLQAVRASREATVVLHAAIVAPAILALVPRTARAIAVGKRGGCQSTPQGLSSN